MTRTLSSTPSTFALWRRSGLFLLVGAILTWILVQSGWWPLGLLFLAFSLFMAWWVSPLRKGMHTPWASALPRRAPGHAIVIWSAIDRGSSQIQIGLRPDDPRITWVNYVQDADAQRFAGQYGGFGSLPIAIVGPTVLAPARAGEVLDAFDGKSATTASSGDGEAPEAPSAR